MPRSVSSWRAKVDSGADLRLPNNGEIPSVKSVHEDRFVMFIAYIETEPDRRPHSYITVIGHSLDRYMGLWYVPDSIEFLRIDPTICSPRFVICT